MSIFDVDTDKYPKWKSGIAPAEPWDVVYKKAKAKLAKEDSGSFMDYRYECLLDFMNFMFSSEAKQ